MLRAGLSSHLAPSSRAPPGGPVLCSSTCQGSVLLVLQVGGVPAIVHLGELIAVWGFWPYLLSGTICGNLIPFFSTVRLLDNAVH